MAVVLNSEENFFSSSPLRRSHSQPKFITQQSTFAKKSSRSRSNTTFNAPISPSHSVVSSETSSPRTLPADSSAPSYTSTSASSLSLDAHCENDEDQVVFPSYDDVGYYGHIEDLEPPPSPRTGDSYTVSPTSNSTSTNASRSESPTRCEKAEDDTSVRVQPSRHVDYLSHNWKEEDIWASWKYIVSRREQYNNSSRLENASWRTWAKSMGQLKTVSPEKLNWLKDCDVTWLYGPLQAASDKYLSIPSTPSAGESQLSKSNSFLRKKPILKKRSMSEIMLQRSLSSSSLLKQAAAAIQAQQSENGAVIRPKVSSTPSTYVDFHLQSRRPSRDQTTNTLLSSFSSSGVASPGSGEKRHIHFNEQVEQCIAVEVKGDDEHEPYIPLDDNDSDSDDGGIMMKRSNSTRKLPPMGSKRCNQKANSNADSKTIAMLPSTTLKYRADTPEPPETAMKHSNSIWSGKVLSPSPSQDTLRPSKPSTRMLLGDDEEDDDADVDWQPPSAFANRKASMGTTQERLQGLHTSGSTSDLNNEPSGMRRTPSGMFMPYEEDEDDVVSEGLFGKVVDTVNTAKDIAHVIWNVGWRQ